MEVLGASGQTGAASATYTAARATLDLSHVFNLHPNLRQHWILIHWARPGIKPTSSQTLWWALNLLRHNGNSHIPKFWLPSNCTFFLKCHWLENSCKVNCHLKVKADISSWIYHLLAIGFRPIKSGGQIFVQSQYNVCPSLLPPSPLGLTDGCWLLVTSSRGKLRAQWYHMPASKPACQTVWPPNQADKWKRRVHGAGDSPDNSLPYSLGPSKACHVASEQSCPTCPLAGLAQVHHAICGNPGAHCWAWSREQVDKEGPCSWHRFPGSRLGERVLPSLGHKRAWTFRSCLSFNFMKLKNPISVLLVGISVLPPTWLPNNKFQLRFKLFPRMVSG